MKINRFFAVFLMIILILAFTLYIIRSASPKQLDDVTPGIACDEKLIEKADVLFVIPNFENKTIDKEFCNKLLAMNKTLGLHGVTHTYHEFLTDRDEEYLQEGIDIFTDCFGYPPKIFRAPQLALSKNNEKIISKTMKIEGKLSYTTNKIYHCNNSGIPRNWFSDWF